MAELSKRDARKIALRSYALQTLLNLRTMQGAGYLFTLWPSIKSNSNRKSGTQAASGFINSHPVFAAFAQGAMLRRIENGDALDTLAFGHWRESLAGPLGLVGDQLIWDRWKPVLFSFAVIPILLMPSLTTWLVTAITILLLYNLPLYRLRIFALQRGYQLGSTVLNALVDSWIAEAKSVLNRWAIIAAGLVFGVTCAAAAGDHWKYSLQFVSAFVVMIVCTKFRASIYTSLLLALLVSLGLTSFL